MTTTPPHADAGKDRHAVESTFAKIERQIYDILLNWGTPEPDAEQARTDIERIINDAMGKARR